MNIVKSSSDRQVQEEWSGLIAIYLFLGGVGAGSYVVAAIGAILGPQWAPVTNAGLWLSFPLVCIGMLFLLSHLGTPGRALLAASKASTSWISRGVLILSGFIAVSAIHFGGQVMGYYEFSEPAVQALSIVGILLAVFAALYTGALLSAAKGYPFWQTAVLPVLFLVSGLLTGLFAVFIATTVLGGEIVPEQMQSLALTGAALTLLEILILFFFLHSAYRTPDSKESAKRMMGKSSFVLGDLVLGLLVPLVIMFVVALGMEAASANTAVLIASVLGLIGGFLLRLAVLNAGMATTMRVAGFEFRQIAKMDFERSPLGKFPPQ